MDQSKCEYRINSTKMCTCKQKCKWQDVKYPDYDDEWRAFKICKRPNTTGVNKIKNVLIDRCTHPNIGEEK